MALARVFVLFVLLYITLASGTFDIYKAFEEVAQRNNPQHRTTGNSKRDDSSDPQVCAPFCSENFTTCSLVDYPLWPVGLFPAFTEPYLYQSLASVRNPIIPEDCQKVLTMMACARAYSSCGTYPNGTIFRIKPCQSLCLSAWTVCGPILTFSTDQDAVNCTATDYGEPRYTPDVTGECFLPRPYSEDTRALCGSELFIDVDAIMPFTNVSRSQVQALVDIYTTMDGAKWVNSSGWGDGDPCTWHGVTCASSSITRLSLPANGISGTIPMNVGAYLTDLEHMDLSFNKIEGIIPTNIGNLRELQYLSLAENSLSGSIPESLVNLHNLAYLNLGVGDTTMSIVVRLTATPTQMNQIYSPLDGKVVRGLYNLTYLNLAHNVFYGGVPRELGGLTKLQSIILNNNQFTSIDFSFHNLSNLVEFEMSNNLLYGNLPAVLAPNLQIFSVINNRFTGTIPDEFAQLASLKQIGLMENELTGEIDNILLPSISELVIGYNRFTGTPLDKFCTMPQLSIVSTYSAGFSGSIPACIGNMYALQILDFSMLNLYGTIPNEIGNLPYLIVLSLVGNTNITGTLPASLGNLQYLTNLHLGNMPGVISRVPESWGNMQYLATLSMAQMGLYGQVPNTLCSISNLQQLILRDNKFSGTLPDCYRGFPQMTNYDLSKNYIKGTIPAGFGLFMPNLISFRVAENLLQGSIPSTFYTLSKLEILDVSSNYLEQSIADIMTTLHTATSLSTINIGNNRIFGTMEVTQFEEIVVGPNFNKLVDFNIGNNYIEGNLQHALAIFPALSSADVSHNLFQGTIDALPVSLKILIANGNPGLKDRRERLPLFLKSSAPYIKDESGTFSCPTVTGASSPLFAVIDPTYYNYSLCMCEPTYYGLRNNCSKCLEHADCSTDPSNMLIPRGYYPTPSIENPEKFIKCPQDSFSENPCNPNSNLMFECKKGHTGRVCAECSAGYHRDGLKCMECDDKTKSVKIFFACFAIVLLYAFLLWPRAQVLQSSLLKNFLFYTQAVGYVLESAARWASPVPIIKQIFTGTNFNIGFLGIECDSTFHPRDEYLVTLFLPIIFVVLTCVAFLVVTMILIFSKRRSEMKLWAHRAYFSFLFLLNILYFPLTSNILSAFNCSEDPITHKSYMASRPYIECSADDPQYHRIRILAAIFFVPYIIGIPFLFYILVRHNRKTLHNNKDKSLYTTIYTGFFVNCYQPEMYWWELITFVRRFLLSIFLSLIPYHSPFLTFSICLLLVFSVVLNTWKIPFILNITNVLEVGGFFVVLVTFLSGVLFSSTTFSSDSKALAIVIFVLNMIVIVAYIVSYISIVLTTRLHFRLPRSGILATLLAFNSEPTPASKVASFTAFEVPLSAIPSMSMIELANSSSRDRLFGSSSKDRLFNSRGSSSST